ncbi:hypothetical protein FACS1894159_01890 [Bacteroidia bacterium]|nr:hypothetical protein FACS1894159_01890 [Bacteroidia bacterium]
MKKTMIIAFSMLALAANADNKTQREKEVRRGERIFITKNKTSIFKNNDGSRSEFVEVYDKAQWDRFKNEYESKGESGGANMVRITTTDSELKAIIRRVFTDAEIKKYDNPKIFCLAGLDPRGSIIAFRVAYKKTDTPDIPEDKLIELQQAFASSLKYRVLSDKAPYYSFGFVLHIDRAFTNMPMFPPKGYKKP